MADDGLTFLFEQGDELLLLLNQRVNLRRLVVEELGDLGGVPQNTGNLDIFEAAEGHIAKFPQLGGLDDDDPEKDKKLDLLKSIFDDNKAMRKGFDADAYATEMAGGTGGADDMFDFRNVAPGKGGALCRSAGSGA